MADRHMSNGQIMCKVKTKASNIKCYIKYDIMKEWPMNKIREIVL